MKWPVALRLGKRHTSGHQDNAAGTAKSWVSVSRAFKNTVWVLAAFLLMILPANGQLKLGETSNNLNGTLSGGYNADYGNLISSSHSLSFGGTGTLSGFYYNPNFLSYTVSPYVNQARDNSSYQSISNASGVNATASIFSGSKFPGSVTYAKSDNSEGNYAIPGVANYTTKGNSDTFAVSWAEILPDWPTLSATFQKTNNQYSIYGSNDMGNSDSKSFSLRSNYIFRGFNLNAFFSDGDSHSNVPEILEGSTIAEKASSSGRGYGIGIGHVLPLNGSFAGNATRSDVNTDFAGYNYNGTVDTYTVTTSFQPTQKFHFYVTSDYSDNLTGTLYQAITSAGGIVTPPSQGESSHSFDATANASYTVSNNLGAQASAQHRQQSFEGKGYSADSFGEGLVYQRIVLGGNLNASGTITENTVSSSSEKALGFNGSIGYNKRFHGWAGGVFANYSQNVQTLLITYTSSFYGYGANIRRRWGNFGWSAGASWSRTGLTQQQGTTSDNQSYFSSINYTKWLNLNGSFSKASGSGIEGGTGLISTPTPQPVFSPTDLILIKGTSFSFGLGSNPIRRLTIAASFAKANGNSNVVGILSENNTEQINTLFQYQFRKMFLTGGFSILQQGFSASGTAPEKVSAYYIGVSRWFNFF